MKRVSCFILFYFILFFLFVFLRGEVERVREAWDPRLGRALVSSREVVPYKKLIRKDGICPFSEVILYYK